MGRFTRDVFKQGRWEAHEDEYLRLAMNQFGERQWRLVASKVPKRSPIQCLHRWTKILKPGLVKGPWTSREDRLLMDWVEKEGACRWTQCAQLIEGRSGKQCRERWLNILRPDIKRGDWTLEEDRLIFQLFEQHGARWTAIAKNIPGRSENSIKNRFYSSLRKIKVSKAKLGTRPELPVIIAKNASDERMVELITQVKELESMLNRTRNQILYLESSLISERTRVPLNY